MFSLMSIAVIIVSIVVAFIVGYVIYKSRNKTTQQSMGMVIDEVRKVCKIITHELIVSEVVQYPKDTENPIAYYKVEKKILLMFDLTKCLTADKENQTLILTSIPEPIVEQAEFINVDADEEDISIWDPKKKLTDEIKNEINQEVITRFLDKGNHIQKAREKFYELAKTSVKSFGWSIQVDKKIEELKENIINKIDN